MSSIQTGIELNDRFTDIIYGIMDAVNMTVACMEDMQRTMNTDMDTAGIEAIHDEINQATIAMDALNAAMADRPVINREEPIAPQASPTMESPVSDAPTRAPPITEPVEVPVTWNTDGLEVFTSTGIERFQQEAASANAMLEQLCSTQDAIARQAYNTDVFSPQAFQNLNSLEVRIDNIRARIQQIENNPINFGTDTANAALEQLRSQLNQAVEEQSELNSAMQNMDVSAANDAYLRLSQTVGNTERYIRDNVDEQGRFNQEISSGTQQANELTNTIKRAVAAYVSIQSVGKALDISDELTQTTSRLDMMNNAFNEINGTANETSELVNMVYAAAQDARGSFSDMAAVVAKFGNNAGDAFGSSEEVVAFANLVQKQMTIAGASTQESSNAMLQLSQALGSGVLRGDELNSIFEQAPNLIQSIADYLEVPIGEIREMASKGELSADVVKAAIFSASDEINEKFQSMPMTWGQIWTSMQNTALMAFQPVFQRLNDIANSEAFQTFMNNAINTLATLANIVLEVFDFIASCGQFVADNWSIISPVIYGVAAALAVYGTYLGITKAMELASVAAGIAHSVMMSAKIGITAALTGSTMAATAAQLGYNGALYACPLVWIIVLIIAVIAIIILLCNWIAKATGAANSGIGIIVGLLYAAVAVIKNLFVALVNAVIDIFVVLWNFIAAFANFLGNIFNDPIGSIARLFFDLVDTILSLLQTLASAIDTIFGSNLAGAVQGWRDSLGGWVDKTLGKGNEIMATISGEEKHIDRFEYGDAWDAGVAVGDGISSAIDNFSLSDVFGKVELPNQEDYGTQAQFSGMGDTLENIAGDTGSISDALDITEEDLKYLRDIAEQETVNRYTVAEVNIDMSGMQNTVKNGQDLDGFVSDLTDAVNEAVDSMTEGVHE